MEDELSRWFAEGGRVDPEHCHTCVTEGRTTPADVVVNMIPLCRPCGDRQAVLDSRGLGNAPDWDE